MSKPLQRALLIGVGHHDLPRAGDHPTDIDKLAPPLQPKNLEGAVNDVLAVEQYLLSEMKMAPHNITILLSPIPGKDPCFPITGRNFEKPTYENIVSALEDLAAQSKAGDLVYVHFSGHGYESDTWFAKWKPNNPTDQCLVPCDILTNGRLLRGLEIGALLADLAATEATITVVFDSCFSGGAFRASEQDSDQTDDGPVVRSVRGLLDARTQKRGVPSKKMMDRIERHMEKCWDWMTSPSGYVFLAASRHDEQAEERRLVKDGPKHGVLTYWLLDVIRRISDSPTEVILSHIQSHLGDKSKQTPQLYGERWRFFFSEDVRPVAQRISVKKVLGSAGSLNRRVVLDAGSIQSVRRPSIYSILKRHAKTGDMAQDDILGRVRIVSVSGSEAVGEPYKIFPPLKWGEIERGCPAVLDTLSRIHKAPVVLKLDSDSETEPWKPLNEDPAAKLAERSWIRAWDKETDDSPLLTVGFDTDGKYSIHGPAFPALNTVLATLEEKSSRDPGSLPDVLDRLEHLAKFHMIKSLKIPVNSPAERLFDLEVKPSPTALTTEIKGADRELQPVSTMDLVGDCYQIPEFRIFMVQIENLTDRRIGAVIINLTPRFGVTCVVPPDDKWRYEEIAPHDTLTRNLYVEIHDDLRDAFKKGVTIMDSFKIIVSDPPRAVDALRLDCMREAEGQHFRSGASGRDEAKLLLVKDLYDTSRGGCVESQAARDSSAVRDMWQVEDIKVLITPEDEIEDGKVSDEEASI